MYFQVSGVEVNPFVPPLVAFTISFFTSMGGVSGAFLLLPYQFSVLGYTTPSVSATNLLFNVGGTPGGILRYVRERQMLWPLALLLIIGTLPGVFLGAWARVTLLPDPRNFKSFA
ncbi:MAG: TSUP family transporter, partial [bacterium]